MILATDLDGTFLEGENIDRQRLYQMIKQEKDLMLVFVSGRGIKSVMEVLNDPMVPRPDYIICDVGATVVEGHSCKPVEPLQSAIEAKWPGEKKVFEVFNNIAGLIPQPVPQVRRCSFFYNESTDIEAVQSIGSNAGFEVIVSAGKFIDVLPGGVNKGSTLSKLMAFLQVPASRILVAGDTMNDFSLYNTGYNGVVVANAEQKLIAATSSLANVYHASKTGCGGILESIHHFYKPGQSYADKLL